jgi:hypothetical protein
VIYEIVRAVIDSIVKWLSAPRVVRVVGGGARIAERVRAAIRRRSGLSDVDRGGKGKSPSRNA